MRISDVSKVLGIPVSTIRYYEKRGIIPRPSRSGRDRSFSAKDISTLQFVRDAQSVGLSLGDISLIVEGAWDSRDLAPLVAKQRQDIRARIQQLQRIDAVLGDIEACSCDSLASCDLHRSLAKQND